MSIVAIIQARMTSTRLPGKVLADICGTPLLQAMIERVRKAERLDAIWVATTLNESDAPVAKLCEALDIPVFRGEEADVLGRYAGAAQAANAETIVRLTADCPMIDPTLIDEAVERFLAGGYDYLSNAIEASYPDGMDVEVFARATLEQADRCASTGFQREHVTPYMRTGAYDDVETGEFKVGRMRAPADFSHLRLTVDTAEDLARVRRLVEHLAAGYGWYDVLALASRRPELLRADPGDDTTAVVLRPATEDDCGILFDWVNRPDSLMHKQNTAGPIALEDHKRWMAARIDDPGIGIWVAEQAGSSVGQVRLEMRGGALEVDIYLVAEARGAGVATAMLTQARKEAGRRWPGIPLVARILPGNLASRRLFSRAGYGEVSVTPELLIYRRQPLESDAR